MINLGYNNRWVRLAKDVVFVGVALWLVSHRSLLAVTVGLLAAFWYGRDAYYQAKALWQEKTFRPKEPAGGITTEPANDGKITITENLSEAKEVEYEKE